MKEGDLRYSIFTYSVTTCSVTILNYCVQKNIRDSTDVYDYLMSKPSVLKRLNHHVTSNKGKVLDLSRDSSDGGFDHFAGLPATAMSATIVSHMQYFINPDG